MDHNSVLARDPDSDLPRQASPGAATATASNIARALRFPGEDGNSSLVEMAKRDLAATLQLLAERAQYITGATGAAIALWEDEVMVCRASVGASAPELGSHLQVNSGLSAESVRLRQILRCDDTATDSRVNRESCRRLGIGSVLVMPLIHEDQVVGVFELFSDKAKAFTERDITTLERMGEMINTALGHAKAARQVQEAQEQSRIEAPAEEKPHISLMEPPADQKGLEEDSILPVEAPAQTSSPKGVIIPMRHKPLAEPELPPPILAGELGRIGKCEACGFPISPGRVLCVDCESGKIPNLPASHGSSIVTPAEPTPGAQTAAGVANPREVPGFLAQYAAEEEGKPGWLSSHRYLVGGLTLAAMAAILWLLAQAGVFRLPS